MVFILFDGDWGSSFVGRPLNLDGTDAILTGSPAAISTIKNTFEVFCASPSSIVFNLTGSTSPDRSSWKSLGGPLNSPTVCILGWRWQ